MLADAGGRTREPSIRGGLMQPKRRLFRRAFGQALLAFASLGEQSERRRHPQNLKSKRENIPDEYREEQIDKRCQNTLAQKLPRIAHLSINGIRGRILEHVLRVSSDEVIETHIQLCEEVGRITGESLRYKVEIGSAG